jgi:hypothetical protein
MGRIEEAVKSPTSVSVFCWLIHISLKGDSYSDIDHVICLDTVPGCPMSTPLVFVDPTFVPLSP